MRHSYARLGYRLNMSNENIELIKDKKTWNPATLSDEILLDDHRILHAWWSTEAKGKDIRGWSKEDISNAHELAAQEMTKRKLGTDKDGKHDSPLSSQFDQPYPAWKRDGPMGAMLFLPNILDAFTGDYMLCEDFVTIVGGLCNHGRTKGDIDVLFKTPEPPERSPLGMATQFRIARTLAKIGIPEERIQFLYDDYSGPFTNHVHVYDLILKRKSKRELHEMSARGVTPFKFVVQPKPIMGRFKEEIFSTETVAEVIKELRNWGEEAVKNGVFVEQKRDGFRIQAHKVGDKVKILTEENNDVTNKLPSFVEALKNIKHNFVVEGEGELWLDGKHQNRADANAIIQAKSVPPQEKGMQLHLYDIMHLDGEGVFSDPYSVRHKALTKIFPKTKVLSVNPTSLVNSLEELKSEVIIASKKPGSEGAMIKKKDYIYPLKPHTSDVIKFKNEFSVNVEIVEVHDVKGAKTKNYLTAIRDRGKSIPMGRTYNTNIISGIGDKIRVVFVELSKYIDPKTKQIWFNFWAPRVVDKTARSDSLVTVENLVKKSGGQIQSKPFPTRYRGLLNEDSYIDEFLKAAELWDNSEEEFGETHGYQSVGALQREQPPVLDLPKEKKPYPFVIQEHIRGKSSHLDFRLAVNNHLIGFTLDDPGRVGDSLRFSNDPEFSTTHKVLVQAKARQPKEWLKTAGDIEPGAVGATKFLPARFKILDKGTYEMGSQKVNFLEVWLKGKKYNGRFVFRKLPRPSDTEKAGKKPFVWFTWKPIKQTPYVLSRRAINEGFVPPKGRSALPKEWEDKISSEFRWWEKNWTGSKAIKTITEIRKIFLKRDILQLSQLSYTLQKKWWKGQKVIRDIPIVHYALNFSNGISFDIDSDPLISSIVNGVKKTITDKEMNFSGQIPAGSKGNPNKKIPLTVEMLDKGKVEEIESTDNFISWKFSGSKLKGFWIGKTKDGGWVIQRSQEAPKPKKLQSIPLSNIQKTIIEILSNRDDFSLSDIATVVGCSKSSVIYHINAKKS